MRVAHFKCFALALCAIASIVILAPSPRAQQPSAAPQPQTQSAAPTDAAAQIDELLKKAGQAVSVQGRMKDAEAAAQQALDLSEKVADKARMVRSLGALATAYFYESRFAEALERQQRAVELARELADKKSLLRTLNAMATILRALGRYEEAFSYYNETAALARELSDLPMQWVVTRNLGVLYMEMGDLEKAQGPLKDALRIAGELKEERWKGQLTGGAKIREEASLETLGNWELGRQHFAAAVDYYERALASKPDNPAATAEILTNMAAAREKLGESQKSVDLLQEAIRIQRSTGTEPNPVMVADLAYSQESLGRLSQALAGQERALAMLRQSGGNPFYEWQVESRIAHVERTMGRAQEALQHYQDAIKTIDLLRAGALNTESGRAFALAASHATYAEAADLLVTLHLETEALEMAERGRARAFLDVLAMSRNGLADELTPDQRAREDALLARISAIQKELWMENIPAKEEQQHKTELAGAEDDLEAFHLEVRRANPRYASIRYPEPISVTRIQNDLLNLNTVLVEFLLGEKRSLAWVVSKDKVTVSVLPAQKAIEEQVAAYRKVLTERATALTLQPSLAEIERRGNRLYASLFQPIEGQIPRGHTIIVVPDGVLCYVPFETLVTRPRRIASAGTRPHYLIENFAIVYAPSASALKEIRINNPRTPGWSKTFLAFGDPISPTLAPVARSAAAEQVSDTAPASHAPVAALLDGYAERGFSLTRLPYARDEVLSISKLYPSAECRIYLGEQAKEETVKSEKLDQYRYIHFASHGFIDETVPTRSGILFSRDPDSSEDGVLQTGEIMRLKLSADLVTLSACSTGLGRLVNGEGILGLTRAFFYSGARNVAVSLWDVNDSATSALMKAFYENLNRGLPKREALRQAKISLLHSRNTTWHHPYFWAPFVLVGEGN